MGTAQPRAVGLLDLPVELLVRVLEHLMATRDLGRAGCVCRTWRAGDSPVERVLRQRIEARGGAVTAALPSVAAASITHQLCLLDSIGAVQTMSGVISLGQTASAAVDVHGHLCVWGWLWSSDDDIDHAGAPIFRYTTPTVVHTTRLERVSVSSRHIVALTDAGEVLSFGAGWGGPLGHGDEEDQHEPKVIEALLGVRVVAIAAGDEHSMVLTDEGEVLSFGNGQYGRLGHGNVAIQREPKMVEALRGIRVVAIAAGYWHSLVLTDGGAVLSFGHGASGKIGNGDWTNNLEPKVIEALRGVPVVAITAGFSHSMVLTNEGAVLSFGNGQHGRLGHGDEEEQLVPKVIAALRGRRVVAIAAGGEHSMVMTEEGAIFSFGDGTCGKLGHGPDDPPSEHCCSIPTRIPGLQAYCSVSHPGQ